MKRISALLVAALVCTPARAELFQSNALGGAALGAAAGAIIGNNSGDLHHNAWRGAAIGAGAGLLIGAISDHHRDQEYRRTQVPVPSGYYGNRYVYRPVVRRPVYYSRPNYMVGGTILGGIAGGIIGHNNHNGGWRGAAIGAGAGLLLGAIAESAARNEEATTYYEPAYAEPTTTQAPANPQNVTIINNYYSTPSTPMSSANSMFGR